MRAWVSTLKEGKSDFQPQVCLATWELKPYLSPSSSRRRAKSRFLSPLSNLLWLRKTKPLCLCAPATASLLPHALTLKISPGSEEESLKTTTPSHRQQGHLARSLVHVGRGLQRTTSSGTSEGTHISLLDVSYAAHLRCS